jgi:hypothetical protein
MVVGFTTTYTMTGWGFPPGVLRFPPPIKLTACNWNIGHGIIVKQCLFFDLQFQNSDYPLCRIWYLQTFTTEECIAFFTIWAHSCVFPVKKLIEQSIYMYNNITSQFGVVSAGYSFQTSISLCWNNKRCCHFLLYNC